VNRQPWDILVSAAVSPFAPDRTKARLLLTAMKDQPYFREARRQYRMGASDRAVSGLIRVAIGEAMKAVVSPTEPPRGRRDVTRGTGRPASGRTRPITPLRENRGPQ